MAYVILIIHMKYWSWTGLSGRVRSLMLFHFPEEGLPKLTVSDAGKERAPPHLMSLGLDSSPPVSHRTSALSVSSSRGSIYDLGCQRGQSELTECPSCHLTGPTALRACPRDRVQHHENSVKRRL